MFKRRLKQVIVSLLFVCGVAAATNDYYTHGSGVPATGSLASSATMRSEFDSIVSGFDKLPTFAGNANLPVFVNSGASALAAVSAPTARANLGLGTIATQDANNVSLTGGTVNATVLQQGGVQAVTTTGTQTLTNKTLTSPIIGTISNTGALTLPSSTDTLVGRDTTDTLTNKTLTSPTINGGTITGTLSGSITFSGANNPNFTGTPQMNSVTGAAGQIPQINAAATSMGWWVPRGYIGGLTLSTAGSSTTMSVAAGEASDSTNTSIMKLTSSINKTTSAWSGGSGNGCLDTGAISNSTTYHFYEVMRPDTGVVDVLCSLSASSPTMQANYTLKRRIASWKTDSSGKWVAGFQIGDWFELKASVTESVAASGSTTTLTGVPSGIRVLAKMEASVNHASAPVTLQVSPTDSGFTPGTGISGNAEVNGTGSNRGLPTQFTEWVDTAAGLVFTYTAGATATATTRGWMDYRGRMD